MSWPALLARAQPREGQGGGSTPRPLWLWDLECAGVFIRPLCSGRDSPSHRGGRNRSMTRPSKYQYVSRHFARVRLNWEVSMAEHIEKAPQPCEERMCYTPSVRLEEAPALRTRHPYDSGRAGPSGANASRWAVRSLSIPKEGASI
jgi:hypothetical protein